MLWCENQTDPSSQNPTSQTEGLVSPAAGTILHSCHVPALLPVDLTFVLSQFVFKINK